MMRYRLLCLLLLLCLTMPLQAQDNLSPYEIALQRIEEARVTEAKYLNLEGLGLTYLPSEITQLKGLESLSLSNNVFESFPPEIIQLINLRALSLSNNSLTTLPPEIGQLINLQRLNISGNELTELPPEIGQLHNLRTLWLGYNNLTFLPAEVGQLRDLQVLFLHRNSLTALPTEIGQLENLCHLILINNNITQLPSSLGNVTLLKQGNFNSCPTLGGSTLALEGNPLVSPPPEVVEQGTTVILDYLLAEQERIEQEKQRMIIGIASGVGLLAALVLGVRFRQQRRKPKQKRETNASDFRILLGKGGQ